MNKIFSVFDFIIKFIIVFFIIITAIKQDYLFCVVLLVLGILSILIEYLMIKINNLNCELKHNFICIGFKVFALGLMFITPICNIDINIILTSISIVLFFVPMELLCFKDDYKLRYLTTEYSLYISIAALYITSSTLDGLISANILLIFFVCILELIIYKIYKGKNDKLLITTIIIHSIVTISLCIICIYAPVINDVKNFFEGFVILLILIFEDYFLNKFIKKRDMEIINEMK